LRVGLRSHWNATNCNPMRTVSLCLNGGCADEATKPDIEANDCFGHLIRLCDCFPFRKRYRGIGDGKTFEYVPIRPKKVTSCMNLISAAVVFLIATTILHGCQANQNQSVNRQFKGDSGKQAAFLRPTNSEIPNKKGVMTYVQMSAPFSAMNQFRADKYPRRTSGRAILHLHLERDFTPGFPIFRLIMKPQNFSVGEIRKLGPTILANLYRDPNKWRFLVPLPQTTARSADNIMKTDWVFCPACFDGRIDSSKKGLRIASGFTRSYGRLETTRTGTLTADLRLPSTYATGDDAYKMAQEYGKKIKTFRSNKKASSSSNKAYRDFIAIYTKSLPETEMKTGNCQTENSSSVGDIRSKRRALNVNRAAVRCRTKVLNRFDINSYRANYADLQRQEKRLFAATFGVKRSEILPADKVLARAKKMVRDSKLLASSFGSDVRGQLQADAESRRRNRQERAAREKIFRSAAETNRKFQKQQRDVGTQRTDSSGRITTRSQREAEARNAAIAQNANRRSSQTKSKDKKTREQTTTAPKTPKTKKTDSAKKPLPAKKNRSSGGSSSQTNVAAALSNSKPKGPLAICRWICKSEYPFGKFHDKKSALGACSFGCDKHHWIDSKKRAKDKCREAYPGAAGQQDACIRGVDRYPKK